MTARKKRVAEVVPFRTRAEIEQAELQAWLEALEPNARAFAENLATIPNYQYPSTFPQIEPPPKPGLESAIVAGLAMCAWCKAVVAAGVLK